MIIDFAIDDYARRHSTSLPALLEELDTYTRKNTSLPQMLSGPLVGELLKLLIQMNGAKKVLEIGTFTGYSALCMALGLPEDGKLITCEIDKKNAEIALAFFQKATWGGKIELKLGSAVETLKTLPADFDFVFIDADKRNYPLYFEESLKRLRVGGVIVIDNCFWDGKVVRANEEDADEDERTMIIHKLNESITKDPRVENILLTIRDGVQVVRKLKN